MGNNQLKSSKIDWIGLVPHHWKKDKLFRLCHKMGSGGTPRSTNQEFYNGDIPWIQSGDLTDSYVSKTEKKINNEALATSSAKIFPKGTLLVAMYGATIGKLGIMEMDAATNQACCALQLSTKLNSKFIYYLMRDVRDYLITQAYGGGQPNISQEILKQLHLFYPSLPEQKAIADYLDKACHRIDKIIEIKERQLDALSVNQTTVLFNTLTRGLNCDVEFVDSNILWMAKMPKHWKRKRVKDVVYLKSGDSITSLDINEFDEFPVYGGNGFRGYTEKHTHDGEFVLIGRQGALCGNINYAQGKFWASEHAVVATPVLPCSTLWIGELLKTMNLNQYSNAAAQPGLAVDKIKQLYLPVPPYKEQIEIADFIKDFTNRNNKLKENISNQITTLQSYRKSLIHECITGKKQVWEGEIKEVEL